MTTDHDAVVFQRRLTLSWILLLLLGGVLLTPHVKRWFGPQITGDPRPVAPRGKLADFEQGAVELYQTISPSVVFVNTREQRQNYFTRRRVEVESGTGSGFIWDKHGHIVTNYHVVKGREVSSYEIVFQDGKSYESYEASLVGVSPTHDLAVLRADLPEERLRPVPIGESETLQVGQAVFAIGNPFRLGKLFTSGIVTRLNHTFHRSESEGPPIEDVILTDAAINPGNSGGPLLDSAGRLIGVNTAIYSPSGGFAGIGVAVPVDTVNRVVPSIIANRKYQPPRLGFQMDPQLDRIVASQFGVQGIVILAVTPGGPAERAGLEGAVLMRRGIDVRDVVMSVGGQRVTNRNELRAALESHSPGDRVTLEVTNIRSGQNRSIEVVLE